MAEDKKSFVLYSDLIHTVRKMPKEKQGELFMTILAYVNDENPTVDDLMVELVFEPIKLQMKRDLAKYESTKERRKEAGRIAGLKSGEARKVIVPELNQIEPKRTNGSKNEPNEHVTDTVNVNDNVTVTVSDTDILLKKETKEDSNVISDELKIHLPAPKIDFNGLVSFFNTNRGTMPEVKKLTKARESRILSLEKQHGKKSIIAVIEKSRDSPFMQGDNKENWTANFDWIFKPANFLKILEDNYARKQNTRSNNSSATDAEHKQSAVSAVNAMFGIK